jgi:hypothetical protein
MNLSRPSPAELRSAFLLPYEIVRVKPVQVIKLDRVVVARRMQHHAVRGRARLFVADIGVAHETSMMIDGSPPVSAVPYEFATGFAAPLDFLEAPLFRGHAGLATRRGVLLIKEIGTRILQDRIVRSLRTHGMARKVGTLSAAGSKLGIWSTQNAAIKF